MAPNRRTDRSILAGVGLLVIAVACIITAGCMTGTSSPGPAAGLTGVSWTLDTYLTENGTLSPILPGTEVTIRFDDDGEVVGSAGCNQYGSTYNLSNTKLSILPPISTKMYCGEPEGLMEQEARFLELLESVAEFQIENDRLEITDTSGATLLTFVAGAPADLTGTSWALVELVDADGSFAPVISGTTITAIFDADGDSLGGSAGCNHYSADYTTDSATITIGNAIRTEMYCDEPKGLMEQEDRYLSLLTDVSSYQVEGDRLIFSDEEGVDLLIFERTVEVPDLPLVETDWVLEGHSAGDDAVSSVITGTVVTLKFTDDGNVTGNAGCNHYGGGYTLDDEKISISSLFTTLMYCGEPEGLMEQEARYLKSLGEVASYQIKGDHLTLLDEGGNGILFFVQAEEVPPVPLIGTEWMLTSYSLETDAISSVIAGTVVTAEFTDDGKVVGDAGCNQYGSDYTLNGTKLSILPPISTKMYCGEPEGLMEQEARYLNLLESVRGYQIDGDRLDLLDETGEALLSYRAGSTDLT